jgi:signal transduction histidine kinase
MDGQTIVIIDDDPNARRTLTDILKVKGYEPFAAKDGAEGLALLRRHQPRVALIDLGLPDISGLDVLNRVRTEHTSTEAIIVTGNATLDSAIEATNKGAFSYIQKPYEMDHLLLIVRNAIEKRALADKVRQYQEHLEELVRARTMDLEKARDSAESGSRAKTDFISNMSHELRTPLNAIIGFSEVLLDGLAGSLNEKQKEYVRNILCGGRTLHDLTLNVLNFSEAESGRMTLRTGAVAVRDVLRSSISAIQEDTLRHQIAVSIDLQPDADREIEADAEKLLLILSHLLNNAVKFTPDGGSVSVQARKVQSSKCKVQSENQEYSELRTPNSELHGDFIEISVADTGIGIKKVDLPRLFREFSQLEDPITKTYRGAGLGLALARKLVELHGGTIGVESEFGKGSTFRIVLPVKQNVSY